MALCHALCDHDECIVAQGAKWAASRGIEDASQQGWVYLLEARKRWDPGRGTWGMYAHHAIRSKFMDQLRARSRRLQPFDCVELFPFFDDCREKVSASEKHEDRHVERIDAKRALEGLAARGMDIEAAIGRREQNPYSREKWGIE